MRRITLLTPHFLPETNAAARRLTSLAEGLYEEGWHVTIVTLLPHYPQNEIYPGYDLYPPAVRCENGIHIIRLRPWLVPKDRIPLRILAESLFCLRGLRHVIRSKPNVVLATSPYMLLGPTGLLASRLAGTKFVWDVRDLTWLYPRAARKVTYGLDRPMEYLMRWTASRADALSTATDGLLEYFRNKPRRALVFANGVSDDWLERLLELPEPSPSGRPVVMYAGLLGFNQNIATLLEMASLMPDVDLAIAGDGPERAELEARATAMRLDNVEFLGFLGPSELLSAYARATVLVAHLRGDPVHRWSQPSKLWEYLATGRPVVYGGEGETVEIINRNRIGVTTPPEDPEALAATLRGLLTDPVAQRSFGAAGRYFVAKERTRSSLVRRIVGMLNGTLDDMQGEVLDEALDEVSGPRR